MAFNNNTDTNITIGRNAILPNSPEITADLKINMGSTNVENSDVLIKVLPFSNTSQYQFVSMGGLSCKSLADRLSDGLWQIDLNLNIPSLSVSDSPVALKLENFNLTFKTNYTDKYLSLIKKVNIASYTMNDYKFSNIIFDLNINNIIRSGLNKLKINSKDALSILNKNTNIELQNSALFQDGKITLNVKANFAKDIPENISKQDLLMKSEANISFIISRTIIDNAINELQKKFDASRQKVSPLLITKEERFEQVIDRLVDSGQLDLGTASNIKIIVTGDIKNEVFNSYIKTLVSNNQISQGAASRINSAFLILSSKTQAIPNQHTIKKPPQKTLKENFEENITKGYIIVKGETYVINIYVSKDKFLVNGKPLDEKMNFMKDAFITGVISNAMKIR